MPVSAHNEPELFRIIQIIFQKRRKRDMNQPWRRQGWLTQVRVTELHNKKEMYDY